VLVLIINNISVISSMVVLVSIVKHYLYSILRNNHIDFLDECFWKIIV